MESENEGKKSPEEKAGVKGKVFRGKWRKMKPSEGKEKMEGKC